MIFDSLRQSWNEERFKKHWSKISTLLGIRTQEEELGQKGKVLATNYELASHATRALEALRKIEELDATMPTQDVADVRRYLQHLTNLPALPKRDVGETSSRAINRLYNDYKAHKQVAPGQQETSELEETGPDKAAIVDEDRDEQLWEAFSEQAEERLNELDERTALILVAKLRARLQEREGLPEAEGLTLADRPMPAELQAQLLRMTYAAVGQPFKGESWYNLLIATWLNFHARHDRGDLAFDYESAVKGYRQKIGPKMGQSVQHEAAFANMQGAIYSQITGEPYDFRTPDEW